MIKSEARDAYRDNLNDLQQYFPDKRILTIRDVMSYTGREYQWCKKHLAIDGKLGITLISLAGKLADLGSE